MTYAICIHLYGRRFIKLEPNKYREIRNVCDHYLYVNIYIYIYDYICYVYMYIYIYNRKI